VISPASLVDVRGALTPRVKRAALALVHREHVRMTARVAFDRRWRVLIVNGFVDGREMYVDFLRHHDLEVRGVARPRAALRILRRFRADVIVTDFAFPEGRVDGVTFISVVRQQPGLHDPVVIVVSGFTQPADERRARAAGADAFLMKPCLPERLFLEMRRFLALHHAAAASRSVQQLTLVRRGASAWHRRGL
jgi:CheY-like chemotaxis protein